MLVGLLIGGIIFLDAPVITQQIASLIPVVGFYVLGRAFENFNNLSKFEDGASIGLLITIIFVSTVIGIICITMK